MRLLTSGSNGELQMTRNLIGRDEIPPYAILSHTWVEDQEVTYQGFCNKLGTSKSGYGKLLFCARQARLDGLEHFWVDTCCIDKTNSTELTEAINSMFRWYRNASKCYAYLSDVDAAISTPFERDFRNSRWFTRGWTLQELLAPSSVQFFDKNGVLLGDRTSLRQEITDVTGIPSEALQGMPLEEFKIADRKRWAKNRQTKLEEDEVYSILGLLGIYMPLIYGEGRESAHRRLSRELKEVRLDKADTTIFENTYWLVPRSSNNLFTGRTKLIERVRDALRSDNILIRTEQTRLVITGIGGQGKSEVCIKLANMMREDFWGVFWVDVGSQVTAENSFSAIAKLLGHPSATMTESIQLLANAKQRWLLFLDNADDPAFDYAGYFPSGTRGAIIMTTRIPQCAKYSTIRSETLEGLELEDCIKLLLKAALIPQESWLAQKLIASELVALLESHTLAVIQAGAYVAEGYCRLDQYAHIFRKQRKQLLEHHPEQQQSRYQSVYATFEASITGLEYTQDTSSKDALELLATLSMLHSSPLPLRLFEDAWTGAKLVMQRESSSSSSIRESQARAETRRTWRFRSPWRREKQMEKPPLQMVNDMDALTSFHVSLLPDIVEQGVSEWNDYRLKRASALLTSLSLVKRQRLDRYEEFTMHPLAHAWAKDRLGEDQRRQAWLSTACILTLSMGVSKLWQIQERQLLPHMQVLVPLDSTIVFSFGPRKAMLPLLIQCGWVLSAVRDYIRLQSLLDAIYQELGVTQWNLPPESFSLWILASRAALHLRNTRLAIYFLEHITTVHETSLNKSHPHRLKARHNLARAYNDIGQAGRAVPILEDLVNTYKLMPLEESDPDWVATTQYELTRAYNLTGQTKEAVLLLEDVVNAQAPAEGQFDNHNNLRSKHALAIAYTANGQTMQAVTLLEHVVNAYENLLSETHPDRLLSQQELARAYSTDNQLEKSLALLQHVVQIQENTLDKTDVNLLASQYALSYAYSNLGRFDDALALRKHIVEMYEMVLEESHPDRLAAEYALALTYVDVKEEEKALVVVRRVVEARRKILRDEDSVRVAGERLLGDLEGGRVSD